MTKGEHSRIIVVDLTCDKCGKQDKGFVLEIKDEPEIVRKNMLLCNSCANDLAEIVISQSEEE